MENFALDIADLLDSSLSDKKYFSPELKLWCRAKEGRVKELSSELGVTPAFISAINCGRKRLPVEMIQKTSAFSGIPAAYLRADIAEIFGIKVQRQ